MWFDSISLLISIHKLLNEFLGHDSSFNCDLIIYMDGVICYILHTDLFQDLIKIKYLRVKMF